MNTGRSPLRPHAIFILILIGAAFLRLSGSYWGDQGRHPDERGIYLKIDRVQLLAPERETNTWTGRFLATADTNLRIGDRNARDHEDQADWNIEYYAYGSLPYYLAYGASRGIERVIARMDGYRHLGRGLILAGLALILAGAAARLFLHSPRDLRFGWSFVSRHPRMTGLAAVMLLVAGEGFGLWGLSHLAGSFRTGPGRSLLLGLPLLLAAHVLLAAAFLRVLVHPRLRLTSCAARLQRLGAYAAVAGALVLLLAAGAAIVQGRHSHGSLSTYGSAWLVARPLSAVFGLLTLLALYRLGRRYFDSATALLASAFLGLTVLHIQLSHYYAFDTVLAFFATVAVLYCCHIAERSRFADYLLAGVFIALAIATKFSAVLLPPLYIFAFAVSWFRLGGRRPIERIVAFLAGGAICTAVLLAAEPFAFLQSGLPREIPEAAVRNRTFALLSLGSYVMAFLAIANAVCVYRIAMRGRLWSVVTGAFVFAALCGLTAAGWGFAPLFLAAFGIRALREYLRPRVAAHRNALGVQRAAVFACVFVLLFAAFFARLRPELGARENLPSLFGDTALGIAVTPGEYPYFGTATFRHNINEETRMARGEGRPWTIQYKHTPAIGYQIDNLFKLSMGPPLAILCILGTGWFVGFAFTRRRGDLLVVAVWLLANILVIGTFSTKFSRYMAPYLPFLCFAGALFALHAWRLATEPGNGLWRRRVRTGARVLTVAALVYTPLYAWSFVQTIYHEPHTKERAEQWLRDPANVPPGSVLIGEHYDDIVGHYHGMRQLPLYEEDFPRFEESYNTAEPNQRKFEEIARALEEADFISVSSRKIYGSVMRQENKRYRLTSDYYRRLFSGDLGFRLVASFENPPRVLGIPIEEDRGEESFRVYDHPKISIFRKVRPLTADAYLTKLLSPPPRDIAALTIDDIMNAEGEQVYAGNKPPRLGRPIWQKECRYPQGRWLLALFALSWVAMPYLYRVCGGLPDRGLLLAKPVGLLLLAYFAWLIPAGELAAYGPKLIWIVFLLLAFGALLLHRTQAREFGEHFRRNWKVWLAGEILFLIVFAVFLWIRVMNPDIHGSEKYMDFSFMNAAYRTETFPLKDPWISGFFVNYYYWGHVLYATLAQFAVVPPSYAYNLACATAPALTFLAAVAILYGLTRTLRWGLLGGFLAVFAGNLVSFLQAARIVFRGQWPGYASETPLSLGEYALAFGRTLQAAWRTLWALKDGQLPESVPSAAANYHSYFWLTGHHHDSRAIVDLIPGSVANEFPMWTFIFADLHAHMMVMGFTLTFVGLALSLFLARGSGRSLFGPRTSWPLSVFLFSLFLGGVACINTWDLPTVALLLALTLIFRFLYHGREPIPSAPPDDSGAPAFQPRRPLARVLSFSERAATDVILPLAVIVALGYFVLYWPFNTYFEPRATGARLTDQQFTTVLSFWKIFGVFLVMIVPFLFFALARWARTLTWSGLAALGLSLGGLTLAAVLYPSWSAGQVGGVVQGLWMKLPFEREIRTASQFAPKWGLLVVLLPLAFANFLLLLRRDWGPRIRFALLLSLTGLCIGWGCEVFYIYEPPWGGLSQRWNTTFKFYLHIWLLFSIAGPAFLWTALRGLARRLPEGRRGAGALLTRAAEYVTAWAWLVAVLCFLGAAAVFPALGTYAVLWGGGYSAHGERGNLDGLTWLAKTGNGAQFPGEYEAVAWFNRTVRGNDAVVMEAAPGAYSDLSRWSVNTGMPSVLGWAHHVGERVHIPEKLPRIEAVHRFYASSDRQEVIDILRKYRVDYVLVGGIERRGWTFERWNTRSDVQKFSQWTDLFERVFDNSGEHSEGTQIYRVRRNLEEAAASVVASGAPGGETPARVEGGNLFAARMGTRPGQFQEPRGLTVTADGSILVADTFNHRVQVFESDGTFLSFHGSKGSGAGRYMEPNSVAAGPDGRVYVADTFNHRLTLWDPSDNTTRTLAEQFFGPRCVALGPDGYLYVSDTGNHRVRVLTPEGRAVRSIGPRTGAADDAGALNHPWGLAFTAEGNLVVMDSVNKRIVLFSTDGRYLASFPVSTGNVPRADQDLPDPTEAHLALDAAGRLFITDSAGGEILVYTLTGRQLGRIRPGGQLSRDVGIPGGAALTADGSLLVTDRAGGRILRFTPREIEQAFPME